MTPLVPLTPKEKEVLSLIKQGHAPPVIAKHLGVKRTTITRYHLNMIYKKFGFGHFEKRSGLHKLEAFRKAIGARITKPALEENQTQSCVSLNSNHLGGSFKQEGV